MTLLKLTDVRVANDPGRTPEGGENRASGGRPRSVGVAGFSKSIAADSRLDDPATSGRRAPCSPADVPGAETYALEKEHWWYRGLRDLATRILRRPRLAGARCGRVLDVGCGSGENLRLLRDLLAPRYLGGFDLSRQAVEHAKAMLPSADVYQGDLCSPEIHAEGLDLIMACDVCTAVGLPECRPGLAALVRHLRPGGWLFLHEPAGAWLYSGHDVAVGNRQRFNRSQVRTLLEALHLEVELLSYRVFALLPIIAAARLPTILRPPAARQAVSDVRPCPWGVNQALAALLTVENRLLAAGRRFPCGSSIVALARKPEPRPSACPIAGSNPRQREAGV